MDHLAFSRKNGVASSHLLGDRPYYNTFLRIVKEKCAVIGRAEQGGNLVFSKKTKKAVAIFDSMW
jgi:hypothetical protein